MIVEFLIRCQFHHIPCVQGDCGLGIVRDHVVESLENSMLMLKPRMASWMGNMDGAMVVMVLFEVVLLRTVFGHRYIEELPLQVKVQSHQEKYL